MKKDKWIWMPHPAHFICSRNCQYFLATYVGKYIVSTVGELWFDRSSREIHAKIWDKKWYLENITKKGDDFDRAYMEKFGYEDIGCDHKFETMVFKAKKANDKHKCCPYRINVEKNVDFEGYDSAEDATKGHYRLCNKWSKKK